MMPQEPLLCWDLDRNFPKHIWVRIVSRRVSSLSSYCPHL